MGKAVGVALLLFCALVAYITAFGRPNVQGTAGDPSKVVGAAGQAAGVVGDVAEPWWQEFITQPWAYAAIGAVIAAVLLRRIVAGMDPRARVAAAIVGTVVVVLLLVGLAK